MDTSQVNVENLQNLCKELTAIQLQGKINVAKLAKQRFLRQSGAQARNLIIGFAKILERNVTKLLTECKELTTFVAPSTFLIDSFNNLVKEFVNTMPVQNANYIQAMIVPEESHIILVGDLHGDHESLMKNIKKMIDPLGFMGNTWQLNPNYYLVFLGDYVDRGYHGLEVWQTLMDLKLKNPNNVFILRGNHEDARINMKYGFFKEFESKYPNISNELQTAFKTVIYPSLTFAFFIGTWNTQINKYEFLMLCHGGIEETQNDKINEVLNQAVRGGKNDSIFTSLIEIQKDTADEPYDGFDWTDFFTDDPRAKENPPAITGKIQSYRSMAESMSAYNKEYLLNYFEQLTAGKIIQSNVLLVGTNIFQEEL